MVVALKPYAVRVTVGWHKMRLASVRLILIGIGILISCVIAALYMQARGTMEQEQILYHQVIAEDAFDHIETQLALFIRDEEARPFTHYNFYYVPDEQIGGSVGLYKSPIADLPQNSPIIAYFQINPDGVVQFPHKTKNVDKEHKLSERQQESVQLACFSTMDALNKTNIDNIGEEASLVAVLNDANDTSIILPNAKFPQQRQGKGSEIFKNRSSRSKWAQSYNTNSKKKVSKESYYQAANLQANEMQQQLVQQEQSIKPKLIEQDIERYLERNKLQNLASFEIDTGSFRSIAVDDRQRLLLREVRVDNRVYKQGFLLDANMLQTRFYQQFCGHVHNKNAVTLQWMRGDQKQNTQNLAVGEGEIGFYHQMSVPFEDTGIFARMLLTEDQPGLSVLTLNIITALLLAAILFGLYLSDRTMHVMQRFAERRQNFAAAVSHELKTPLTAIRMHAEMLESGMVANDDKRDEYYHTIHAESQRLSRLIDNVLTLSRIEKDDYQLQMTIGDVKPVIDEAVSMLEPHATRNGFSIAVDADDELMAVRYDHDALMQIVVNAIDNSIKFAKDAEEKLIHISLKKQDGGLALRIRDFGPGVPQEHQAHVFEAFYRGERELTRNTKGTGIGLALVKNLCDAMGAGVSAGNAADKGFQLDIKLQAQS